MVFWQLRGSDDSDGVALPGGVGVTVGGVMIGQGSDVMELERLQRNGFWVMINRQNGSRC